MAPEDPARRSNAQRALESVYGEKQTPFTEEEYGSRLERVRREMERQRIDTLLVSDPANLYYLSGYRCAWYQDGRPRTWYPASCIAVHVDADEFIYFEDLDEIINSRITSVARDRDSRPESGCQLHELRRGARMKTTLVDDFDPLASHAPPPRSRTRAAL